MVTMLSRRVRRLSKLPVVARFFVAALIVILAFVGARLLTGLPFLLFYPAILVVAVVFDHRSSLFATLLAAALAGVFLFDPMHGVAVGNFRNVIALAIFVATGWGIGAVVEALREAVDNLLTANLALLHASEDAAAQRSVLDAIIQDSDDLIYVKDRDGRFVHVNESVAKVLGTAVEKVLGTRDRDYLPAEEADAIERIDQALMASGGAQVLEEQITTPGLPVRIFQSSKFAWKGGSGNVRGIIGISRDITAAKAAEDRLRAADAQKQLLLYDINHRVKNHLQTVGGLMGVAARRAGTLEAAREALIDGESRLAVLGRVYSRLQAGTEASVVDARGFIEELCSDLKASLLDMRPVVLKVEAERVPIESSRAVMLGLAINELVQNSIKYAFPGDRPGVIRVEFQRKDGRYRLSVGDDGVGIADGAQPAGSGEGQRLIRAMAQQLGGSLVRTGHAGTMFVLSFPVETDSATQV